jgi:hypothetical protein
VKLTKKKKLKRIWGLITDKKKQGGRALVIPYWDLLDTGW